MGFRYDVDTLHVIHVDRITNGFVVDIITKLWNHKYYFKTWKDILAYLEKLDIKQEVIK